MTVAGLSDPVVVDTDVLSFVLKGSIDAERYRRHIEGRTLVVSFMTVAELHRWALKRRWGQRRHGELDAHLAGLLVTPFDNALCRVWAEVTNGAERRGRPIMCADAWVGATAVLYGFPLVTNNAADYAGVNGIRVITEKP